MQQQQCRSIAAVKQQGSNMRSSTATRQQQYRSNRQYVRGMQPSISKVAVQCWNSAAKARQQQCYRINKARQRFSKTAALQQQHCSNIAVVKQQQECSKAATKPQQHCNKAAAIQQSATMQEQCSNLKFNIKHSLTWKGQIQV